MDTCELNTNEAFADLALVEPPLPAAEGDVVHLLVAAVVARFAVRAARRGRHHRRHRATELKPLDENIK